MNKYAKYEDCVIYDGKLEDDIKT